MSELKLDLELLKNKTLFQKIMEQSDLVKDLFSSLANDFPQKELRKIHQNAKGTKISKGYNLENFPYQVLDLIRDFDGQTGFNIRVLNWWGNGLFIFVYFGGMTLEKHLGPHSGLAASYRNCDNSSPWAYGQIISKEVQEVGLKQINDGFSQFFKQIDPDPEYSKTYSLIKKEIRFVLDNHS